MTPHEKVALLLTNLEPQLADRVLSKLGTEWSSPVRARMAELASRPVAPEILESLLQEFDRRLQQILEARRQVRDKEPAPSPPAADAATADAASHEIQPEVPPPDPRPAPIDIDKISDPLAAVRLLDPERLARALHDEQPRTVALLLGYLEPDRAGEVLRCLSPDFRRDISAYLGKTLPLGPAILQHIARAILQKCQLQTEIAAEPTAQARFKNLADMLRRLDKADRLDMLAALEENDPETASGVKDLLYQFEDLLLIDDRSMQKLLSEVDSKSLALALKSAPDAIKEKVLNNLSKRARESLTEEMEFLGPVSTTQTQQAQKVIVEVIQRLDQLGELIMTQ